MQVVVSSLGTDLDAWTGVPFGACSQFWAVDTETMESVVVSVPTQQQDLSKVSVSAIRAIARQGAEAIITGPIKGICKQTKYLRSELPSAPNLEESSRYRRYCP